MSAFAGIVVFGERPIEPGLAARLTSIISPRGAGRPRVQRNARAIIVQAAPAPAPNAQAPDAVFVASSRLHNAAELAAQAGLPDADEAGLIRKLFETRGDAGLAQLLGAFTFAHWNETAGELTLCRDYNGARPLFFHRGDGFVAFASYLPDLLAMPDVPRQLDETMVAHFLALNHREYERSFYVGIDRVPTRSRATFTQHGVEIRRYWSPRLDAPAPCKTDEEYVERARELFDRAVARCLKDTPKVAILTSGGLDSSAVAATAARQGHDGVTCYTGVPPDGFEAATRPTRYADERPKVDLLAAMYPSLRIRYIAPEGSHPYLDDGARLFSLIGLPIRNPCNLGWFGGIEDAIREDGHKVTLNGSMGNFGLTWTGRDVLRALAAKGRFGQMLHEAQAHSRVWNRPVWRVLAAEAVRSTPGSVQDLHLRLRGKTPGDVSRYSMLREDAIQSRDLRRQWSEAGFDPHYRPPANPVALRAHQIYDQLQLARDTQAMSPIWKSGEVRDPHADRELLEFCLAVPEEQYQRGGVERWFARQVFADRLPPEILNERLRGEQSPNWFESLSARKEGVGADIERIEASPLGSSLIDVGRLKRLYANWPKSVADGEDRIQAYRLGLTRAVHVGQFIRWVEGGNG